MADELLQRVRRIETRVTQLLVAAGIDSGKKPVFVAGPPGSTSATILLPSPHSSMKEILDNIPEKWEGPVEVMIGTIVVATITRGDRSAHQQ
jgi:hypothetical protein